MDDETRRESYKVTTIRAILTDETDLAIQIRQDRDNRSPIACWIPRSQCSNISKLPMSKAEQDEFAKTFERPVVVKMQNWLAEKHNLSPEA